MLDAKGKTKDLTSEAAEKSASADPQHQITTDDAKGKGLIQEGISSGKTPRSGIVITHRRHWETWQQREDRYRLQQEDRRREEERRRQECDRHRDHWNYPFFIHSWEQNIKLLTVRDCPECNDYNRHDRSDRRYQNNDRRFNGPIRRRMSVHDWLGAGSVYMIGLVNVLAIFQETKRSLKRWQMHDFPMSLYFAGMLTLIGWN